MAVCPTCGTQGEGAFCPIDGTRLTSGAFIERAASPPAPPPRRASPWRVVAIVLGAVSAVVVVVLIGLFLVARSAGTGTVSPPVITVTTRATTTAAAGTPTASSASGATPAAGTPTASDPQATALAALRSARDTSRSGLALDGRWVLQLSSKYDGVTDQAQTAANGTHVFRYSDILAQFQQLAAKTAASGVTTRTLLASDFGTRQSSGSDKVWVLIADPGSLPSRDAAQARCASLFPTDSAAALSNDCLPRTLVPPS